MDFRLQHTIFKEGSSGEDWKTCLRSTPVFNHEATRRASYPKNYHASCRCIVLCNQSNYFLISETPEQQSAEDKAVEKDIDEWIYGYESVEYFVAVDKRSGKILRAGKLRPCIVDNFPPCQVRLRMAARLLDHPLCHLAVA